MAYHVIDPSALDAMPDRPSTARSISDAAELSNVGVRLYEAEPGEQIPLRYHYHDEQEELFFVIEGELHVETPDEEYAVSAGQVFVAEPGNPHRAFNPEGASDPLRVYAIGAPSVSDGHAYVP